MYNKLSVFAFWFWSAEDENSDEKIPGYWLLEYSTANFFSLEHLEPWTPVAAGASTVVLRMYYASCLFSLRAHHPYLLIPWAIFFDSDRFFFSYFLKYTVISKLVFAQLTEF